MPHTTSAYLRAVQTLFERIGTAIGPVAVPIKVYVAGGAAAHWHTGARVSRDVDAEFGAKVLLGEEILVNYRDDDGSQRQVYLDPKYSSARSLMHDDFQVDAEPAPALSTPELAVFVLSPVDLAVSKLSRWSPVDRGDIAALAKCGLLRADALEDRARQALVAAVGAGAFIEHNLREAVEMVRGIQP